MSLQREMEAHVLSAVSEFVASLNSSSGVVADMTGLAEVTSRLPLSNLEYWERLIRSGVYQAAAAHRTLSLPSGSSGISPPRFSPGLICAVATASSASALSASFRGALPIGSSLPWLSVVLTIGYLKFVRQPVNRYRRLRSHRIQKTLLTFCALSFPIGTHGVVRMKKEGKRC